MRGFQSQLLLHLQGDTQTFILSVQLSGTEPIQAKKTSPPPLTHKAERTPISPKVAESSHFVHHVSPPLVGPRAALQDRDELHTASILRPVSVSHLATSAVPDEKLPNACVVFLFAQ